MENKGLLQVLKNGIIDVERTLVRSKKALVRYKKALVRYKKHKKTGINKKIQTEARQKVMAKT